MDNQTAEEIFEQIFSLMEALETQSAATLQFLKDKGVANEKELAPYLEQAGQASSVRFRAARVRVHYLLASTKPTEKDEEKERKPEPKKEAETSAAAGAEAGSQAGRPTKENEEKERGAAEKPREQGGEKDRGKSGAAEEGTKKIEGSRDGERGEEGEGESEAKKSAMNGPKKEKRASAK